MKALSLQSGSNGNCYYVEAEGTRLLFDAGLSGRETKRRLAMHGLNVGDIDALIISHDHSDHARNAGVLHRMFDIPLFLSGPTLDTIRGKLGRLDGTEGFSVGDTLQFGPISVETIPTPHDAVDGTTFVVCANERRIGILTDLGHPFPELHDVIRGLDGVFIESNYDPEMLETGPYPEFLKSRIRGPAGHISNVEAAQLLEENASDRLEWVCLAHLSEKNNRPDLAIETHQTVLPARFPLHVATRHEPSEVFEL